MRPAVTLLARARPALLRCDSGRRDCWIASGAAAWSAPRDGCLSGIAAVSAADPRRPLSASCLQARRRAASGPLASAGDEQGARGTGGSALLIAGSGALPETCRIRDLLTQSRVAAPSPRAAAQVRGARCGHRNIARALARRTGIGDPGAESIVRCLAGGAYLIAQAAITAPASLLAPMTPGVMEAAGPRQSTKLCDPHRDVRAAPGAPGHSLVVIVVVSLIRRTTETDAARRACRNEPPRETGAQVRVASSESR